MSTYAFDDSSGVERLKGTLNAPGATVGDVLTVQADQSIAAAPGGGALPDPITDPLNVATTDASKVPLKITLPAGFDLGAYDAIEIEDSGGLRLLSFDVGGNLGVTANPALGTPAVTLGTDQSIARITLQQGSDASATEVVLQPGAAHVARVSVLNTDTSAEHALASGATAGTGTVGFFGHAPVAQPTGVAVDAAGLHAALVTLGLITA